MILILPPTYLWPFYRSIPLPQMVALVSLDGLKLRNPPILGIIVWYYPFPFPLLSNDGQPSCFDFEMLLLLPHAFNVTYYVLFQNSKGARRSSSCQRTHKIYFPFFLEAPEFQGSMIAGLLFEATLSPDFEQILGLIEGSFPEIVFVQLSNFPQLFLLTELCLSSRLFLCFLILGLSFGTIQDGMGQRKHIASRGLAALVER